MKRYIYIVLVGVLLSFTSCTMTDIDTNVNYVPSPNSGLQFIGAAEDFDVKDVSTRADEDVSDSHISEMTLLIFKENGDMLPAVGADQRPLPSSHINIRKPNPTFLIEANKYEGTGIIASMEAGVVAKYYDNKAEDLANCKIYIVANAYHLIGELLEAGDIKTEDDLLNVIIDAEASLAMPVDENNVYIGIPMIGVASSEVKDANGVRDIATFDLTYRGNTSSNAVATIPLKKLCSKVCFTMQVNSLQYVQGGEIPQFELTDVEVFNVPAKVRMGYQAGDYVDSIVASIDDDEVSHLYLGTEDSPAFSLKGTSLWPSQRVTKHDSSDKIEFHFFMPEHKVTPFYTRENYGYPDNLPKDRQQYYKPKLVAPQSVGGIMESKFPTFVRIHGTYTTHNAEILDVSYDIYLGQNEIDDFEVKRNQQLNNYLTITGLTNHKDAYPDVDGNISIDHRVTMTNKGYILSMEREAILDSHFEVRPLDVTLSPGGKMTIVIPEAYRAWIAMEDDAAAYTGTNSPYESDVDRKGVRKYFTTNLVSELNAKNSGTIELANDGNNKVIKRVWFYIDENPDVYDETLPGQDVDGNNIDYSNNNRTDTYGTTYNTSRNLYRLGKVNFYYSGDGTNPDTSATPNSTVNFQQWNLWRVWNTAGNRYYDIEHEEEYLNNYASDQQYGPAKDGMPWGLEGVVLSDHLKSFYLETSFSTISNALMEESKPYYDFYITQAEANGTTNFRPFAGQTFSNEIMGKILYEKIYDDKDNELSNSAYVSSGRLIDSPKSAVEYCYRKNKTIDNNGTIIVKNGDTYDTSNVKWFLPSIDQINEIVVSAYTEFDAVFQHEWYWSSQPAYDRYAYNYNAQFGLVDRVSGFFYQDDVSNARATQTFFDTTINDWNPSPSGSDKDNPNNTVGTHTWTSVLWWVEHNYSANANYVNADLDAGNKSRTDKCRIRAVYRSGTKQSN